MKRQDFEHGHPAGALPPASVRDPRPFAGPRPDGDRRLLHRESPREVPPHIHGATEPGASRPQGTSGSPLTKRGEHDIAALGLIVAAIILFVGTGSSVLTQMVRHTVFGDANVDQLLANALLLNVALIIFGWRRYLDLTRELSARREGEQAALLLAETDPLTGCLNRRSFDVALNRMVTAVGCERGDLAVVLIDLDRFKRTNDSHGHQVGDAVLIATAMRIREGLPRGAILARLGGDEFCAATPHRAGLDGLDEAEPMAMRIGAAISRLIHCGDHTVSVTASIGLAAATIDPARDPAAVASELMHRADVAMYQAKKTGRNRTSRFDPAMEQGLLLQCQLEQDIRLGLRNGEFLPYYEKQVDIATGEITGFEMLARWHSPERGVVGPDVFVHVAEDIGVMPAMSEMLIRRALIDALEWAPHLTLSINISPVQLRDTWFAQRLLKLLVEAGMPPARIEIEITEICLNENLAAVRALATSLHNQGIRISLDDFGHSYSSLAHLSTLPFDRIKIDRTFIATLLGNADSAAIIEAIAALSHGMDLPVIAEGIETQEILTRLQAIGTFQGQGYIYGRPMTAAHLRDALADMDLLAVDAQQVNVPAPSARPDSRSG